MRHMFLKAVVLVFRLRVTTQFLCLIYSFIANRSLELSAFFFNTGLRTKACLKSFVLFLLFPLITFDFQQSVIL